MRLRAIWPASLAAFALISHHMRVAAAACPYPIQCHPHPKHQPQTQTHTGTRLLFADDLFPDPAGALHLARKCGGSLLSISGAALYRLSCIDPASDWDAPHTEPRRSSVESQQRLSAGLRSARWRVLGAGGWRALVVLQDFLRACTLELLRIPNRCSPMCDEGMREAWGAVVQRALVGSLQASLRAFTTQNRRGRFRGIKLIVPFTLVLRREEGRHFPTHRSVSRASQRSYNCSLRSSTVYRATRRTVRWSRMRRNA
ncbi:hypothetical protein B0H34DRAFT_821687 [Crassisporium funariophilum]|nr:hypothetical protein B0H34DRAFT_821687 [Crassisporium funariophilum]